MMGVHENLPPIRLYGAKEFSHHVDVDGLAKVIMFWASSSCLT